MTSIESTPDTHECISASDSSKKHPDPHHLEYQIHKLKNKHPLLKVISEDVNITYNQFHKLKVAEIICCGLACLGFGCGAITYDLTYNDSVLEEKRDVFEVISISGTVSTFLLIISICWRTNKELRWEQARGIYSPEDNLFTSGKYQILMFEFILNIFHPLYWLEGKSFPFYNKKYEITAHYTYNAILSFITLVRVYHLIRLSSILSDYRSARAQRVCHINGSTAGTWYAVKCMMREEPIRVVCVLLLAGIGIFGFCLRIFERPLSPYSGSPSMDFSHYENAMWCVVLTMTTVGYGDYYPVTEAGRIVGFVACLWGVLVVSLMVVTLSNMLELESGEDKALTLLRRLEFKKSLREKAALVLSSAARYRIMIKVKNQDQMKLNLQAGRFRRYLNEFRATRLQQRSLYDYDSAQDILERKMNCILEENEKLHERLLSTKERLCTLNSLLK